MLKIAVLLAVFVGAFGGPNPGLIAPSYAQFSRNLILAGGYDGYMEKNSVWSFPLLEDDRDWVERAQELPKMYDRRSFATSNVFHDYSFTFGGNSSRLELQQLIDGNEHIFYEGNGPHPRVGHTATIRNQELYIYGGYDLVHEKFSDHLWMANLTNGYIQWQLLDIEGAPGPRGGHSSILYQESLYIFGGQNEEGFFNDVWRYDFITGVWVRAWVWDEVSEHPFGRVGHVGTFWNDETYVIFGGYGTDNNQNTRFLNDMWAFNLQRGVWTKLSEGSKAGFEDYSITTPAPRAFMAHTVIDGQLIIMGGQVSAAGTSRMYWNPNTDPRWLEVDFPEDYAADVWSYSFYNNQWTFIKCFESSGHGDATHPKECKHNNQPDCPNRNQCSGHGVCVAHDVCHCRGEWGQDSNCSTNPCADGFAGYELEILDRILISESILNFGQKLAALKAKIEFIQEFLPEFEDFITAIRSNNRVGEIFDNFSPQDQLYFNQDFSVIPVVLEEFNEILNMSSPWTSQSGNILANSANSFYYPNVVLSSDDDLTHEDLADLSA